MKQLGLQGITPFAEAPIDAPDEVVTACKSEAEAVRLCIEFARDCLGVDQRRIAKLCGWKTDSYLSEIASEASEKRMPPKRVRKFTLATGNRLLEQWLKRQELIRELTGKTTAQDRARIAVNAMRSQFEQAVAA